MKSLTDQQLAKEVRKVRTAIESVVNLQFKELLIEVERRLNSGEPVESRNSKAMKSPKKKSMTNKEAYNYFLNK